MKKLLLLFILLSTFNLTSFCQNKSEKSIQWGLEFIPNVSHRLLTGSSDYNIPSESAKFSWAAKAIVAYPLSNQLSLTAGLGYTLTGYQTPKIDLITETVLLEGTTPAEIRLAYNYHLLNIPLGIQYRFPQNHYLHAGFAGNFLLKNELKVIYLDNTPNTKSSNSVNEYNEFLISTYIGYGLEKECSEKMTVYFEPRVEFFLTPIVAKGSIPVNRTLYQLGLAIGCKF